MQKIVTNKRHGGFSLSDAAIHEYAAAKGLTLYPEAGRFGLTTYWTVPEGERSGILSEEDWRSASLDERKASNEAYSNASLYDHNIPRDDPDLIAVVERMGEEANGRFAELHVTEIPDGVEWEIQEYDGAEWVAETHRTW